MLEVEGIYLEVGDFRLGEADLEVGEGEYFVLLGPSGSGKSLFLEVLAGLRRPDRGRISWKGEDVTRLPPEERGFSLLYQDYALFPHMTVEENIAYGPRAGGLSRADARRAARRAADLAGASHLLRRMPGTLSGGEKQRVALARALAPRPALVLLDEPLSALDWGRRRELRRELRDLHGATGTTFLHVTHDPEEALYLADRIGVMLRGRLRGAGRAEEIFRNPPDPEVGAFLGMRNLLPAAFLREGYCLVGEKEVAAASAAPGLTHVWIKPEDVLLSLEAFPSSARNQFEGRVADWEPAGPLLAVKVDLGGFSLAALVTRRSFEELGIGRGRRVFCTFKSSAVVTVGGAGGEARKARGGKGLPGEIS